MRSLVIVGVGLAPTTCGKCFEGVSRDSASRPFLYSLAFPDPGAADVA